MSYERAFEALRDGDYPLAASLLGQLAENTGFASDPINHAYTLALYRAGQLDRLAAVALRIGASLVDSDPGSAMDYFQRAFLGGLDPDQARRVEGVLERWALPRRQGIVPLQSPVRRVAHVLSSLSGGRPEALHAQMLIKSLRGNGVESLVFTTESAAAWFVNPSGAPLSKDLTLQAETFVASVEGDFEERAARIAEALRLAAVDAAFFHGGIDEAITARVASHRAAPLQVNVCHDREIGAGLFEGYLYVGSKTADRMRSDEVPSEWIAPMSEIGERLELLPSNTREQMGLESAGSVSATFGDLRHASGGGFLQALAEVLHRFPRHFHLFAGPGNVRAIRAYLHDEGLLPRVRFLGPLQDLAPILGIVDLYLAPFPSADEAMLVEAMGAGVPAVVMRYPEDSPFGLPSRLLKVPELLVSRETEYAELAHRLIRDVDIRLRYSDLVTDRFSRSFHASLLGPRYLKFVERLLEKPR